MVDMLETFIDAIHSRQKLRVEFYSKEDEAVLTRTCAPMDYGPSRRAKDQADRFHVWDYDSDTGPHPLSLPPEQLRRITVLEEEFDPGEFVTWDTEASPWFIERDWGRFS